jgi:hypothetical protein
MALPVSPRITAAGFKRVGMASIHTGFSGIALHGTRTLRQKQSAAASAQFAQHFARLPHVKRIQPLREALQDLRQQGRSLAATPVSFQQAA